MRLGGMADFAGKLAHRARCDLVGQHPVEVDRPRKGQLAVRYPGEAERAVIGLVADQHDGRRAGLGGRFQRDRHQPPADAERLTGYKVGGISPFGQRKPVPAAVEEMAVLEDEIYLNGGQRGLQIRMRPDDLVRALGARVADLIR